MFLCMDHDKDLGKYSAFEQQRRYPIIDDAWDGNDRWTICGKVKTAPMMQSACVNGIGDTRMGCSRALP
jgi:hypothetical protein